MKLNKKYIPAVISLFMGLGYLLGSLSSFQEDESSKASKQKLNQLIDFISNEYVDEVNVD